MLPFLSPEYNYEILKQLAPEVPESMLKRYAEDIFIEAITVLITKLFPDPDVQENIVKMFSLAARNEDDMQKLLAIINKRAEELSITEKKELEIQISSVIMNKAKELTNMRIK